MFNEGDLCLLKINGNLIYAKIDQLVIRTDAISPAIGYDAYIILLTHPSAQKVVWTIADFHMDGREFGIGDNRVQFLPIPFHQEYHESKERPADNVVQMKPRERK
jgi:hypothetical protein